MAKIITINLNDLRRPKNYLRGRVSPEYVRKLEQDAREAMTTADDRKTLHTAKWPFPHIIVRRVEVAAKKEGQPAEVHYEVIDGNNRLECAKGLFPKGDFALDAEVRSYANDAEAFADQLKLNNDKRGLYLDRDSRNRGIITLRDEFKMPVRRIAALTGVSHASVVRIKKGTQGKGETGARAKAARARHAKKATRTKKVKVAAWSAKQFIKQCAQLSRVFDDHQPEVVEMVKRAGDRSWNIGRPFAKLLTDLAG